MVPVEPLDAFDSLGHRSHDRGEHVVRPERMLDRLLRLSESSRTSERPLVALGDMRRIHQHRPGASSSAGAGTARTASRRAPAAPRAQPAGLPGEAARCLDETESSSASPALRVRVHKPDQQSAPFPAPHGRPPWPFTPSSSDDTTVAPSSDESATKRGGRNRRPRAGAPLPTFERAAEKPLDAATLARVSDQRDHAVASAAAPGGCLAATLTARPSSSDKRPHAVSPRLPADPGSRAGLLVLAGRLRHGFVSGTPKPLSMDDKAAIPYPCSPPRSRIPRTRRTALRLRLGDRHRLPARPQRGIRPVARPWRALPRPPCRGTRPQCTAPSASSPPCSSGRRGNHASFEGIGAFAGNIPRPTSSAAKA